MGSLNPSIMHCKFSPSLGKRGMKKRQGTEVPGAATNTDVLLKVHQDLAKDKLECSSDGNMRKPLLVFHSQTVFIPKPQSANTCPPKGSYCSSSEWCELYHHTSQHYADSLVDGKLKLRYSHRVKLLLHCWNLRAHWQAATPVAVTQ